jgi:hypothetical protein
MSPALARAAVPAPEPLYWHPRFAAHTTAHGQVILLEDGDCVLFEAGPTTQVARSVTDHMSVRELLALERGPAGRYALQRALDELVALDLVLPAEAYRAAARGYRRPAFDAEPRVLGAPGREVQLLTTLSETAPQVRWATELAAAHRVAIAIVDDELDPRLEAIDQRRHADATPWLLFKPRGRRPSLGPWFTGGVGGPCWSCLRSRMLSNQPVRRWLVHQAALRSLAVPITTELLDRERLPPPSDRSLLERLRSGTLQRLRELTRGCSRELVQAVESDRRAVFDLDLRRPGRL